MTPAQDSGKVVSPKHWPLLPHERLLVVISFRGWVDTRTIVRSEGFCQWKITMTPAGIEPATFRFVSQHLNHCAAAVPYFMYCGLIFRNSTFCRQNTFFFFFLRTDSCYSVAEIHNARVSTSILSCLYGMMLSWLQTTFRFTWPYVSRLRCADQTPPDAMWQDVSNQHHLLE